MLTQLEHALRSTRHAGSAATGELEQRLTNLQHENRRLKATRQEAATRLDSLLENLKSQLEQAPAQAQTDVFQDDAA